MSFIPEDFSLSSFEDVDNGIEPFSPSEFSDRNEVPVFSQDLNNDDMIDFDLKENLDISNSCFVTPKFNEAALKSNMFTPNRTPLSKLATVQPNSVTPTKPAEEYFDDPVTPTANLKMLMSAISPEIRNREKKKELFKLLSIPGENSCRSVDSSTGKSSEIDAVAANSRKDKSLGLLCQKFISRYPEYPSSYQQIEISLDSAANELGVERRRIYDIVNVLESVEVVSKSGKNRYAWHGKTHMVNTLTKLKAFGEAEGYGNQIRQLKQLSVEPGHRSQTSLISEDQVYNQSDENRRTSMALMAARALLRKDKSLGIMSQKFLMLFLVADPQVLNLDLAAKIIIGDSSINKTEYGKYKTKIRRLYDIANILTSLGLIAKCHVTEQRGRKPAFKYVGPYLSALTKDELWNCDEPVINVATELQQFPNSVENKHEKTFSRHSSFEQICRVVEEERRKLTLSSPNKYKVAGKGDPLLSSSSTVPTFPKTTSGKCSKLSSFVGMERKTKIIKISKPQLTKVKSPQTTILQISNEQLKNLLENMANTKQERVKVVDAATQSSPLGHRMPNFIGQKDVQGVQMTKYLQPMPSNQYYKQQKMSPNEVDSNFMMEKAGCDINNAGLFSFEPVVGSLKGSFSPVPSAAEGKDLFWKMVDEPEPFDPDSFLQKSDCFVKNQFGNTRHIKQQTSLLYSTLPEMSSSSVDGLCHAGVTPQHIVNKPTVYIKPMRASVNFTEQVVRINKNAFDQQHFEFNKMLVCDDLVTPIQLLN